MEVSNQEDFVVWSDPDCADACMLSEGEGCPSTSNDRVALGDVTAQFQDFYMKVVKIRIILLDTAKPACRMHLR